MISIRRHLHTTLFRPAMLDQQVPWTVSMSEQRSLPSHVRLTSLSKIPIRFFWWEFVAKEPGERWALKVRRTQKCCRLSNHSKRWERILSVWKAELILALSYAITKKQHLNFATSPPSLAPVVTLPHRDFPMRRVGQEKRVGGSVCVGGSMKERLSSLIPRQAAREVLTN